MKKGPRYYRKSCVISRRVLEEEKLLIVKEQNKEAV